MCFLVSLILQQGNVTGDKEQGFAILSRQRQEDSCLLGKIFGGRVLMAELDFCEAIQPNYIGVLSMLRQRGNVDGYFDSFHEMNLVNMRAASVSST
ncbi:uncharacterized protein [Physcomitrium patens]|uniref:uncharacterized protein isoform X2 n=1 Tax=Physcomitrium patens TaxID=3218 RepID=UPI003CCD6014